MAVEFLHGMLPERICPEPLPAYTRNEYATDYGKVEVAQIPRPGKPKLILFPGFAGYPDPTGEVLDELSSDFWPIEFGEPYHSLNRNPAEQHISDSQVFEQALYENIPFEEGEKGIFAGASFGTLTLAEFAHRNLTRIHHAVFLTPAGCLKKDNLLAMGFRYGRETIKNSALAVKHYGKDALVSPMGTTKKAAEDIPAAVRRGRSVIRGNIRRKMLALALAGIPVTNVYATEDGLFNHLVIKQNFQEELTAMYAEKNNENRLVFSEHTHELSELMNIQYLPGGHDLGCTGRPREYAKILKRFATIQPVR
jgi:hypothetical protein